MTEENWSHDFAKSLAVFLNGKGLRSRGPGGEQIVDDSFYVIFNAYHGPIVYQLPPRKYGRAWTKILDTSNSRVEEEGIAYAADENIIVEGRSVVLLHRPME